MTARTPQARIFSVLFHTIFQCLTLISESIKTPGPSLVHKQLSSDRGHSMASGLWKELFLSNIKKILRLGKATVVELAFQDRLR